MTSNSSLTSGKGNTPEKKQSSFTPEKEEPVQEAKSAPKEDQDRDISIQDEEEEEKVPTAEESVNLEEFPEDALPTEEPELQIWEKEPYNIGDLKDKCPDVSKFSKLGEPMQDLIFERMLFMHVDTSNDDNLDWNEYMEFERGDEPELRVSYFFAAHYGLLEKCEDKGKYKADCSDIMDDIKDKKLGWKDYAANLGRYDDVPVNQMEMQLTAMFSVIKMMATQLEYNTDFACFVYHHLKRGQFLENEYYSFAYDIYHAMKIDKEPLEPITVDMMIKLLSCTIDGDCYEEKTRDVPKEETKKEETKKEETKKEETKKEETKKEETKKEETKKEETKKEETKKEETKKEETKEKETPNINIYDLGDLGSECAFVMTDIGAPIQDLIFERMLFMHVDTSDDDNLDWDEYMKFMSDVGSDDPEARVTYFFASHHGWLGDKCTVTADWKATCADAATTEEIKKSSLGWKDYAANVKRFEQVPVDSMHDQLTAMFSVILVFKKQVPSDKLDYNPYFACFVYHHLKRANFKANEYPEFAKEIYHMLKIDKEPLAPVTVDMMKTLLSCTAGTDCYTGGGGDTRGDSGGDTGPGGYDLGDLGSECAFVMTDIGAPIQDLIFERMLFMHVDTSGDDELDWNEYLSFLKEGGNDDPEARVTYFFASHYGKLNGCTVTGDWKAQCSDPTIKQELEKSSLGWFDYATNVKRYDQTPIASMSAQILSIFSIILVSKGQPPGNSLEYKPYFACFVYHHLKRANFKVNEYPSFAKEIYTGLKTDISKPITADQIVTLLSTTLK